MKLLAIDTATEACSASLLLDQQVSGCFDVCPQQHSQRILPMIDGLLADAQVRLQDLDAIVFGRGPGSFTGVRIAMGVLQGLALGAERPVIGVSTLATMAQQAYETSGATDVVAAIDARMDEVYFAHYRLKNGVMVVVGEESVLSPDKAAEQLPDCRFNPVGTGWEAYSALTEACTEATLPDILYPDARYMLNLGKQAFSNDEQVDIEQAQPVYLRDKVTWKKLPGR